MISTLIFDLDGLLADTEKLHRRAYQEVFAGVGLSLPDEHYDQHWIRDGKGIDEYIFEHHLGIDPSEIRPRKAQRYEELVRSCAEAMPGAASALASLREFRMTLATSSYRDAALAVLNALGIQGFFEHIATKESAGRMKPFPDIFLGAASATGVSPRECIVIEDAQKGILAADAAGMPSIAIPNRQTRDNDFSKATLVLRSLEELTRDAIERCDRLYRVTAADEP